MFKTNSYFDKKVLSIAFDSNEGKATVGVMAPGEYTFGTTSKEYMTVVSGEMEVQLPGESTWKTYKPYEMFEVEANQSFNVKVSVDSAYKCIYK
ncbi:pyrimidine/purine nucleoside phosphorylase [uncultured Maribacter sp.]|uniref:pyrimidine/purine nucleoside phosphorylase n=1 Tax=uncultured Maribacter sp. TaxID=431308 RepID=UPI00262009C6|nr:pyrimidine/purine nucleoside phosphorylase [uncultured Maribacter sp.]